MTTENFSLGLITTANIVIALVLRRASRSSIDFRTSNEGGKRDLGPNILNKQRITSPKSIRPSTSSIQSTEIISATNRRTSTQVTRMLLAVTLTLILCNIPNTIFFVLVQFYDTRRILIDRICSDVTDQEILLYKFGFYSSVIQDILSDLPHIVNFFLYCLAGRKFRSIFIYEVRLFLLDLHLIKRKERRSTQTKYPFKGETPSRSGTITDPGHLSPHIPVSHPRKSVEILYAGKSVNTRLCSENKYLLNKIKS